MYTTNGVNLQQTEMHNTNYQQICNYFSTSSTRRKNALKILPLYIILPHWLLACDSFLFLIVRFILVFLSCQHKTIWQTCLGRFWPNATLWCVHFESVVSSSLVWKLPLLSWDTLLCAFKHCNKIQVGHASSEHIQNEVRGYPVFFYLSLLHSSALLIRNSVNPNFFLCFVCSDKAWPTCTPVCTYFLPKCTRQYHACTSCVIFFLEIQCV